MIRMAKFEKVSYEQFKKDFDSIFKNRIPSYTDNEVREIYSNIKLPERKTTGSAGYDFHAPITLEIVSHTKPILIPTGIRARIADGWVLQCYPRSGLGFKHRIQLDNTVGIIDSDYYYSDNEGHIMAKLTNDSKSHDAVIIKAGEGFMQGVFVPYGITEDDVTDGIRNGGFGSTNERNH